MRTIRKIIKSTRGQSMVEMAIMLPLLLLMFFGIIEFGLMLGSYVLIHDLARDGVRAGVVGAPDNDIINQIESNGDFLLDTNNFSEINIKLEPGKVVREVGDSLTVEIRYLQYINTPIISKVSPVELHAEYTMRIEKT